MVRRGEFNIGVYSQTTGKEHEIDMLGKYDAGELVESLKGVTYKDKMPLFDAIRIIVREWPEKVKIKMGGKLVEQDLRIFPEKALFGDIYQGVAESLLGKKEAGDEKILKNRLLFFNSLNTPADWKGVDAFFIYKDDNGDWHLCTIDVTINRRDKETGYKADVTMLDEPPDPATQEDEYLKWVDGYAGEIASDLKKGQILYLEDKKRGRKTMFGEIENQSGI